MTVFVPTALSSLLIYSYRGPLLFECLLRTEPAFELQSQSTGRPPAHSPTNFKRRQMKRQRRACCCLCMYCKQCSIWFACCASMHCSRAEHRSNKSSSWRWSSPSYSWWWRSSVDISQTGLLLCHPLVALRSCVRYTGISRVAQS